MENRKRAYNIPVDALLDSIILVPQKGRAGDGTVRIISFDFAIMIGGVDDFVKRMPKKKYKKYSPRDNVYLEFGLFSGFLS